MKVTIRELRSNLKKYFGKSIEVVDGRSKLVVAKWYSESDVKDFKKQIELQKALIAELEKASQTTHNEPNDNESNENKGKMNPNMAKFLKKHKFLGKSPSGKTFPLQKCFVCKKADAVGQFDLWIWDAGEKINLGKRPLCKNCKRESDRAKSSPLT